MACTALKHLITVTQLNVELETADLAHVPIRLLVSCLLAGPAGRAKPSDSSNLNVSITKMVPVDQLVTVTRSPEGC